MHSKAWPGFNYAMNHSDEPTVLLDFGNVLTHDRDASVFAPLLARLRIPQQSFNESWIRYRDEYDAGSLDAKAYWSLVLRDSAREVAADLYAIGQEPGEDLASELTATDFRSFLNPRMLMRALVIELIERNIGVGILSNMPPNMGTRWIDSWPWLGRVELALWSGDEGLSKPDPAFYRLFLQRSCWRPERTLFVDDVQENLDTADGLGFATHLFVEECSAIDTIRAWVRNGLKS